jgi:hypothetical protein
VKEKPISSEDSGKSVKEEKYLTHPPWMTDKSVLACYMSVEVRKIAEWIV